MTLLLLLLLLWGATATALALEGGPASQDSVVSRAPSQPPAGLPSACLVLGVLWVPSICAARCERVRVCLCVHTYTATYCQS